MPPEHAPTRRGVLRLAPLLAWPGWAGAQALKRDEEVLFLPSTARWLDARRIEVEVQAWVYERERRPGLRTAFARYLGLDRSALSAAERARFDRRCALFLTDSERGKVVRMAIDGRRGGAFALPPTDPAGRSQARFVIDAGRRPPDTARIDLHAQPDPGDARPFAGHALLVPPQGLSVVCDIDDTVKITQVHDRREMLLNTFARPFEPTPGLPAHLRRLARRAGTRLHYLSASPIQLAPALERFLHEAAYPAGSLHLRESTHWRTLIPGSGESRDHKLAVLARLLADFPRRRFVLVGDSGEADPEIYAQAAREHGPRIAAIVIRDVHDEGRAAPRWQRSFEGLPPGAWHLLPSTGEPWPL